MRFLLLTAAVSFVACDPMSMTTDAGDQTDSGMTMTDTDAGMTVMDAGVEVNVRFTDGGSARVSISALPTVMIQGKAVVRLDAVLQQAQPSIDLSTARLGFRASDGFDPASRANCNGLLPVPSANLTRGGIDPVTRNLSWDDMLGYPGCLYVRDCVDFVLAP
ncbi:MAG: hypothetical protein QM817_28570 [Archangium sp.]